MVQNPNGTLASHLGHAITANMSKKAFWTKEWAIEQAVKQRYQLILGEIERRKTFYDQMEHIEHLRLICTILMVSFLLIILIWSYTIVQQQQQTNSQKSRRGHSTEVKSKNGFFLLGWTPGDLYFQDSQQFAAGSSEFGNCYSDDDEDDMSTLIKYQKSSTGTPGQYYEEGEFLNEDESDRSLLHFLKNVVTLRYFFRGSRQSSERPQKPADRPEFVRPIRDLSKLNVITNQKQLQSAAKGSKHGGSGTGGRDNDSPSIQLIDVDAINGPATPSNNRGSFL